MCAYRFEGEELIIDGFERGISEGPYSIFSPSALGPINNTGMVDLSYGNITGIPGEFSVNFPLRASTVDTSGGVAFGTPCQIATNVQDGNSGVPTKYYLLDGKGQVFMSSQTSGVVTWTFKGKSSGGTSDVVFNNGLVWWQGYLFEMRDSDLSCSSDDGVSWTSLSSGLEAGVPHYAISSKVSDTMYFCNGSWVASIVKTPGVSFDPTNAYTFIVNKRAVSLPSYDTANCLAELNGQILIGGSLNRVYPWDANNLQGSGVTSLVGLPLFLGDNFVQRIVPTNSNAYIFTSFSQTPIGTPAGRGYIYVTNGSTIDIYKKMPDNFVTIGGTSSDAQDPYWQFGDAVCHRNKLLFGAIAIGNRSNTTIPDTGGIWAIDLNSNALYRSNLMTSGSSALATVVNPYNANSGIGGVQAVLGQGYVCGSVGVMNNSTTTMSTSARMISDKIPVGTKFMPKTYSQGELKLAIALVAGESIDVTVITDADPSGHSLGSMTSADGMSKVFTPLSLFTGTQQGIQWLQVKLALNPTDTNPTFVRLREVRFR